MEKEDDNFLGILQLWDPKGQIILFVGCYHVDLYILSLFLSYYIYHCPSALSPRFFCDFTCQVCLPAYLALIVQFSSVAQLCLSLCDPMNRSTPGLPVHHQLPESTQSHVHWVSDAIQPSVVPFSSCPQSFPASGSFQMSQLFASGGQSVGVSASTLVLPMNTQDWSPLGWTGWISLQSKGHSRVFSNTTVQKKQFFGAQLSL